MTNFLSADTLLFYFLSIFYTQIFFVECVTHKHTQFYRSIQEVIIIVGVVVVFLLVDIRKKKIKLKRKKSDFNERAKNGCVASLYKLQLYKVKGIIRLKLNAQSGVVYCVEENLREKMRVNCRARKLPK